ncbi:gluconate kinase, FGGY family [Olivibacter domesticus]|uniref:Gluconate kinase, FGGY family n=2 Tax=Olivibacter domesticus TaxID=407022 RepID=A0A1H7JCI3_OLID1|nr:gluconate kinase, FGGY family [Olivibacter domesticus]
MNRPCLSASWRINMVSSIRPMDKNYLRMKHIVAVDIGTSSTKAIALDLNGKIIAEHYVSYPIISPRPSYSEQDPEILFDAVVTCIAQVSKLMKIKYEQLDLLGVSFSSAMHGLIAMDSNGKPLTNCIIWADTRSESFAEHLKGTSLGHDIYMNTGTPIHPMSPLCKLGWMRQHMKGVFEATDKFISIKEYVFYKLFGEYVVDYSIASATGLFETLTQKWYGPALEIAGIAADRLSTLVPITHALTTLDARYAEKMQINADTPFIIGGSDGCLANLGAQAVRNGVASVTIGTSGAIRVVSDKLVADHKERIFSYIISPEMFVLGGAVNNGGNILRWFQDGFVASKDQPSDKSLPTAFNLLTKEASSVNAGSDGLIFLPYLTGERAPHWDASAKGVFFGIQMHHQRAHFIRAMMEGIIFGIFSVGKALEETAGELKVILASGGFARSDLWVQMLADVFNKKVYVKESVESSAVGAAIVAMNALQLIDGFILDDDEFVPSIAAFDPNKENHAIYRENFGTFERLYEKLKDEF